MPEIPPLPELMTAVREIAERAGDLALGAMAQVESEQKADMTLVTAVDRKVEQFLTKELEAIAPGVGFLGEEFGQHGDTRRMWIVDPIDGTNNFVYGVPMWGVSIGLAVDGEAALGVFHLPMLKETFTAYRGGGAFLNGLPIRAREAPTSHRQELIGITTDVAKHWDVTCLPGYFRLFGSIGAEVVYVAKGSLYACISLGDKTVDLGAAICINREAGCELSYLSGEPLSFSEWVEQGARDEPLLIGAPWAVAELRECLRRRGQDSGVRDQGNPR